MKYLMKLVPTMVMMLILLAFISKPSAAQSYYNVAIYNLGGHFTCIAEFGLWTPPQPFPNITNDLWYINIYLDGNLAYSSSSNPPQSLYFVTYPWTGTFLKEIPLNGVQLHGTHTCHFQIISAGGTRTLFDLTNTSTFP